MRLNFGRFLVSFFRPYRSAHMFTLILSASICPAYSSTASAINDTAISQVHVGTSVDLRNATATLLAGFSQLADTNNKDRRDVEALSLSDLQRAATSNDPRISGNLRQASIFFLASPLSRRLLSIKEGSEERRVQSIVRADVQNLLNIISERKLDENVLDVARNRASGAIAFNVLLRDPGIPTDARNHLLQEFSDDQLLTIVGRPVLIGDSKDVAEETHAFLGLARLSWLGAAESEALAHYNIPFMIDRGSKDKGFSYWEGQHMHISEKMAEHGAPGYVSEVLAHEGGHALFMRSGLQDKVYSDAAAAHLANGVTQIMNESFAGVFGNRAHIALFGYKDKNQDANLSMLHDVFGSLVNDQTFYAKWYHVNTAAARAQTPQIEGIMKADLFPYLQSHFSLMGDPDLTKLPGS